jgi:hypothetical protein
MAIVREELGSWENGTIVLWVNWDNVNNRIVAVGFDNDSDIPKEVTVIRRDGGARDGLTYTHTGLNRTGSTFASIPTTAQNRMPASRNALGRLSVGFEYRTS